MDQAHPASREITLTRCMISLMLVLLSAVACDDQKRGSGGGEVEGGAGVEYGGSDGWWADDTFEDHTLTRIDDLASYDQVAVIAREMKVVKFWVTEPATGRSEGWSEIAMSRFYDGRFYTLHDELYWFRLTRGHPVWGIDETPVTPPLRGVSIQEIYRELERLRVASSPLPLDLRFTSGGRLYSPRFYEEVLGSPRRAIVGTILSIPAQAGRRKPEAFWAFELEYSDRPTQEEIISLSALLPSRLPREASDLRWLARSPYQEELAQRLAAEGQSVGERALTYLDLVVPGAAEVYSEGVTAGRVHLLSEEGESTDERDLLIYSRLPDDLPPCRGLLTAIPQTPLAHLNLLARNRGIPNMHVAGIDRDAAVAQLTTIRAPAVLWGKLPDQWMLLPLSQDEYRSYLELRGDTEREIARPELSETELIIPFQAQSVSDLLDLRPQIGGKATGVMIIKRVLGGDGREAHGITVEAPSPLFAMSGKAYAEHLAPIEQVIRLLMSDQGVRTDPRIRTLMLEGWEGGLTRYPRAEDQQALREWSERLTRSKREIIERGGISGWVRTQPILSERARELIQFTTEEFIELHPQQGVRTRSSSNVEDLEGFNGAGLYASFTGFLYPRVQNDPRDQSRDLTHALRNVWASYWGVAAFEERELEGIDHLKGWMGVLLHPRFDNDLERNNGVMTLTLVPPSPQRRGHLGHTQPVITSTEGMIAYGTLNSQIGALSVTNPDSPETLTEVVEVQLYKDQDEIRVEYQRAQASSLVDAVLNDQEIYALSEAALEVTEAWWTADREQRSASTRSGTLTLDFEYRGVEQGWPRRREGLQARPARMILKQARPLEPAPRGLNASLWEEPIPLDVLRRAHLINHWLCEGSEVSLSVDQVYTDPLLTPDLGFSERPFTSSIRFTDRGPQAWRNDVPYLLTHLSYLVNESSTQAEEEAGSWHLAVQGREGITLPFTQVSISEERSELVWIPQSREGDLLPERSERVRCTREVRYASPNDYLLKLVERARENGEGYGSHRE